MTCIKCRKVLYSVLFIHDDERMDTMRNCESCFDEVAVTNSDFCYSCIFCETCEDQAFWVDDALFRVDTAFYCGQCKPADALEVAV